MKLCIICGESFILSKFHPNRHECCYNVSCRRERDRRLQAAYRSAIQNRERQNRLQIRRRRLAVSPLIGLILGALLVMVKQILHQVLPAGGADLYRAENELNRALSSSLEMTVSRLREVMSDGNFAAFTP